MAARLFILHNTLEVAAVGLGQISTVVVNRLHTPIVRSQQDSLLQLSVEGHAQTIRSGFLMTLVNVSLEV